MLSLREFVLIIFRYLSIEMPFPSIVPHIVGDDDSESIDENRSPTSPTPKSPSHSETSYEEGEEDGTDEDVAMDSLDGADWSMIVSHIAKTPDREASPHPDDGSTVSSIKDEELPAVPVINQCSTPKSALPPKLRFLRKMNESQPYPSVSNLRRNCASKADYSFPTSIGGRVARRGRRSISTIRPTEDGSGAATLAKPLDVTAYFHKVSSDLVQNRISDDSFKSLREQLDRLLEQHSNSSKMSRKQRAPRSV